jgi:hypothetical protein
MAQPRDYAQQRNNMIAFRQPLHNENPTRGISSPLVNHHMLFELSRRQTYPLTGLPAATNGAADSSLLQALLGTRQLAPGLNRQQFPSHDSFSSSMPVYSNIAPRNGLNASDSGLLHAVGLTLPSCPPAPAVSSYPITTNATNMPCMTEERISPKATAITRFLAARDSSFGKEGERTYIDVVQDFDVLCGRGGKTNHHSGNKRYRQVVSEMKMMYRRTEAKTLKTDLSRAIVDHVCNYGGRFVKQEGKSGRFYLLTQSDARKKTSQALRESKQLKWTA